MDNQTIEARIEELVGDECKTLLSIPDDTVRLTLGLGFISGIAVHHRAEDTPIIGRAIMRIAQTLVTRVGSVLTTPIDDELGIYQKYWVFRSRDGKPVTGAFVLKPETDFAAVLAILTYAEATDNVSLAVDLRRWIRNLQVHHQIYTSVMTESEVEALPDDVKKMRQVLELTRALKKSEAEREALEDEYEKWRLKAEMLDEVVKGRHTVLRGDEESRVYALRGDDKVVITVQALQEMLQRAVAKAIAAERSE